MLLSELTGHPHDYRGEKPYGYWYHPENNEMVPVRELAGHLGVADHIVKRFGYPLVRDRQDDEDPQYSLFLQGWVHVYLNGTHVSVQGDPKLFHATVVALEQKYHDLDNISMTPLVVIPEGDGRVDTNMGSFVHIKSSQFETYLKTGRIPPQRFAEQRLDELTDARKGHPYGYWYNPDTDTVIPVMTRAGHAEIAEKISEQNGYPLYQDKLDDFDPQYALYLNNWMHIYLGSDSISITGNADKLYPTLVKFAKTHPVEKAILQKFTVVQVGPDRVEVNAAYPIRLDPEQFPIYLKTGRVPRQRFSEDSAPRWYPIEDGGNAIGFWYNPKTDETLRVTWELAGDGQDLHHLDVLTNNSEKFGLPREELQKAIQDQFDGYFGTDEAIIVGTALGWVRVGINNFAMHMDASSIPALQKAVKKFVTEYPEVPAIWIGLVGSSYKDGQFSYKGQSKEWSFSADKANLFVRTGKVPRKRFTEARLDELSRPDYGNATEILRRAGYSPLGQGAYADVWLRYGDKYVLKLFDNRDYGYKTWLRFVMDNQKNPYVPKIRGKLVKVNQFYSAVRLEELRPLDRTAYQESFAALPLYASSMMNGMMPHQNVMDKIKRIESQYPGFTKLVRDIVKMSFDLGVNFDFHDGNIMLRGKTPVLTDPLAEPVRKSDPRLGQKNAPGMRNLQNSDPEDTPTIESPTAVSPHVRESKLSEMSRPGYQQAVARLKQAGYERIAGGGQSEVFARANDPYVVKLFSDQDQGYLHFLKLLKKFPGNPHLPRVKTLIRVAPGYAGIRVERLSKPNPQQEWMAYAMLYVHRYAQKKGSLPDQFNAKNTRFLKVSPSEIDEMNRFIEEYPELDDLMFEIDIFAEQNNLRADHYFANLMFRGNTPVLIDPLADLNQSEVSKNFTRMALAPKTESRTEIRSVRRLDELTRPSNRLRAGSVLEKAGYIRLGSGGYADIYEKPGASYVLKLFEEHDYGYRKFLQYAFKNQDNPHLPRFRGKLIAVTDRYYAIRMERLKPIGRVQNFAFTPDPALWDIITRVEKLARASRTESLDQILQKVQTDPLSEPIRDFVENNPSFVKAMHDLVRIARQTGIALDFSPRNFMLRGDTIVITDPFAGGNKWSLKEGIDDLPYGYWYRPTTKEVLDVPFHGHQTIGKHWLTTNVPDNRFEPYWGMYKNGWTRILLTWYGKNNLDANISGPANLLHPTLKWLDQNFPGLIANVIMEDIEHSNVIRLKRNMIPIYLKTKKVPSQYATMENRVLEKRQLRTTPAMMDRAISSKGQVLVEMDPMEFLKLTLPAEYIGSFLKDAKPLYVYNRYAKIGQNPELGKKLAARTGDPNDRYGNTLFPFLNIKISQDGSAKVTGHEGRHRAAALINQKVKQMPVLLILRLDYHPDWNIGYDNADYHLTWKRLPDVIYGQRGTSHRAFKTDWKVLQDDLIGKYRKSPLQEGRTLRRMSEVGPYKILVDPSMEQIKAFVDSSSHNEIRGLFDVSDNRVYVWDAYFADHDGVERQLRLGQPYPFWILGGSYKFFWMRSYNIPPRLEQLPKVQALRGLDKGKPMSEEVGSYQMYNGKMGAVIPANYLIDKAAREISESFADRLVVTGSTKVAVTESVWLDHLDRFRSMATEMNVIIEDKTPGTFVGAKLTKQTEDKLREWMREQGIENRNRGLHVTVVFDKKGKFDWSAATWDPPIQVDQESYRLDLFGPDKDTLVLKFECPELASRHKFGREQHDLKWDYPRYTPHVSLSYDAAQVDIKTLKLPTFPLEIDREYVTAWNPK